MGKLNQETLHACINKFLKESEQLALPIPYAVNDKQYPACECAGICDILDSTMETTYEDYCNVRTNYLDGTFGYQGLINICDLVLARVNDIEIYAEMSPEINEYVHNLKTLRYNIIAFCEGLNQRNTGKTCLKVPYSQTTNMLASDIFKENVHKLFN